MTCTPNNTFSKTAARLGFATRGYPPCGLPWRLELQPKRGTVAPGHSPGELQTASAGRTYFVSRA
jgi:hypothetical protein